MKVGQFTIHAKNSFEKTSSNQDLDKLKNVFAENMKKMEMIGPGVFKPGQEVSNNHLPLGLQPTTSLAQLQMYGNFSESSPV